jgi:hypothetical protein
MSPLLSREKFHQLTHIFIVKKYKSIDSESKESKKGNCQKRNEY